MIDSCIKKYTCPLTNIDYYGNCPVLDCPSNITNLGKPSGCIHGFLDYKPEIGLNELAYTYNISLKETKERIMQGEIEIQKILLFHDILVRLRDNNKVRYNCSNCGIIRRTTGNCANTTQCNDRKNFVDKLKNVKPFNIQELAITKNDIFLLLHNKEKITEFLKIIGKNGKEFQLTSLLNLDKNDELFLQEMRTIV